MEKHLDAWGKRQLARWVLPASHDSAMYESGNVKSLGRTQSLSIHDQLCYGIRYFDLRPQKSGDTICMHHGPIQGPKLATVLDDVHRFLSDGRREFVILKFSHYDGFDREVYKQMVKEIKASLDPWLYTNLPKGKRLAEVPLSEMLAKHGVALVVCDEGYPLADHNDGIWVYRDWSAGDPEHGDLRVFDRYANVTDYKAMKADQFRKFREYDGKCKARNDLQCDLFLLSWTLTPATHVASYSKLPNQHLADDLESSENAK